MISDKKTFIHLLTNKGVLIFEKDDALRYVGDNLRNDKEIAMICIKSCGLNLRYASDNLKNDKEVVMEAVKQNGKAIVFASPILKENEEILIEAIKNGYINIPPDTEKRHHVKLILERNGHYLRRFEKRYSDDKEMVLAAVTQHGHAKKYASDRLKDDDEILITAISNYPGAKKFLSEKFKYEEKYIKKGLIV